jgi:hypothetical protein
MGTTWKRLPPQARVPREPGSGETISDSVSREPWPAAVDCMSRAWPKVRCRHPNACSLHLGSLAMCGQPNAPFDLVCSNLGANLHQNSDFTFSDLLALGCQIRGVSVGEYPLSEWVTTLACRASALAAGSCRSGLAPAASNVACTASCFSHVFHVQPPVYF